MEGHPHTWRKSIVQKEKKHPEAQMIRKTRIGSDTEIPRHGGDLHTNAKVEEEPARPEKRASERRRRNFTDYF